MINMPGNGRGWDRKIEFEIIKHIGNISTYCTGWSKELNIVSWNGGSPKYDIRDWSPNHEYYLRGITIHERGAAELLKLLASEFIDHEQFNELEIDKDKLLEFLGGQNVFCGSKSKG